MKKVLGLLSLIAVMFVMMSCGGSNTPSGVAEKAFKCMKNKDYKGYADLVNIKDTGDRTEAEIRQELTGLLTEKVSKSIETDGEIESYKVLSEEIAEDGNTAMVKMQVTYSKGKTEETDVKLVKNENGDWMLDMGK